MGRLPLSIMFEAVILLGMFMVVYDYDPVSSTPSDLWITTALKSVMERNGHFDLDHIGLSVNHGTVDLSGSVLTGEEKGLAELLAMQIPGVKAVENGIRVIPALDRDIEIEKESKSALLENSLLHIRELSVEARDGIVTLKGIVYQPEEKQLANRLVTLLPGVKGVRNKIEVLGQA